MTFKANIVIDDAVLREVAELPGRALARLDGEVDRIAREVEDGLTRDLLRFVPPPPNRKIEWTSIKQHRAYFATDGFGAGIPYRRKGTATRGWRVRKYVTSGGNLLTVTQGWDDAPFVIGDPKRPHWQQRFHRITGWPSPSEVEATFAFWSDVASEQIHDAFLDINTELVYGLRYYG